MERLLAVGFSLQSWPSPNSSAASSVSASDDVDDLLPDAWAKRHSAAR